MPKLQTIVKIPKTNIEINHHKKLFFIGSCFSTNIGEKLHSYKFKNIINPFGVLYNPLSIKNGIELIINNKPFDKTNLHFHNNLWYSYQHHSSFSNPDKNIILKKINASLQESHLHLKKTDILFITFGTARAYYLKENKTLVANCHKQPQKLFNNILIEVNEIVNEYHSLIEQIKKFNPSIKIIFTVSPIRHWKDGANGNQVSKSTLLLATNKLLNKHPEFEYFPSYEIFMDELRDYRFYADDMLHPSSLGMEYIWQRFGEVYLTNKETTRLMRLVSDINKAINHKPFNSDTNEHKIFLKNTLQKIETIMKHYPDLNFVQEKESITEQLK